jgi:hypothetical protein
MEWIAPFIFSVLAATTVLQLLWAHSLSAIARKNDLGSLMEVFAWLPLLQLVPMLAVGGGAVGRALLGLSVIMVGNVAVLGAAAMLGGSLGSVLTSIVLLCTMLICTGYFMQIYWNTAAHRGLSGWVGILMFVPLVNFFVYPFIAFHDGWARPHVAGMILGTVMTLGSMLSYLQIIDRLGNDPGFEASLAKLSETEGFQKSGALGPMEVEELDLMEEPSEPVAVPAELPTPLAQEEQRSIRALYDLKGRFAVLDSLTAPQNMRIQDNRVRALKQIRRLRVSLESRREEIDHETFEEFATHLVRVETRVHGPGYIPPSGHLTIAQGDATPSPAGLDGEASPASLSASGSRRNVAPIRPVPVQPADECPYGTELRSRSGEKGDEEWCQQLGEGGGLRHGGYARYFKAGQPEQVGEYRDGLRIGVWTRFHRSGEVRAQAEFERGLQHGWLVAFDESGSRKQAVLFDRGARIE